MSSSAQPPRTLSTPMPPDFERDVRATSHSEEQAEARLAHHRSAAAAASYDYYGHWREMGRRYRREQLLREAGYVVAPPGAFTSPAYLETLGRAADRLEATAA